MNHKIKLILFIVLLTVATNIITTKYGLYDRVPGLNKISHVLGGGVAAWMVTLIFSGLGDMQLPRRYFFIVAGASLFGVLWELAEYTGTLAQNSFPILYQHFHSGNLPDTIGDLAADIVGALIFAIWFPVRRRNINTTKK